MAQAQEITLCSLCTEPATHSFVWEWGESGAVCPKHQVELLQRSKALDRGIQFQPITAVTPQLERSERAKLKAEAIVLEEELTETKQRGLELYRQNVQLTQQVQSLTVRNREQEAQLRDLGLALAGADEKLRKLESENADLSDELGRLRVLVEMPGAGEQTSPGVGQLT